MCNQEPGLRNGKANSRSVHNPPGIDLVNIVGVPFKLVCAHMIGINDTCITFKRGRAALAEIAVRPNARSKLQVLSASFQQLKVEQIYLKSHEC